VLYGPRSTPTIGALALLVLGIVLYLLTDSGDGGDGSLPVDRGERVTARVVSITDGDTIHVGIGGEDEKVRYIGIDTPESVIPDEQPECFGKEASEANRELVEDETVRLVFGTEERDQYGRLLAYVYVGDTFVNAELVRQGFARTLEIAPNIDFAERFASLQQAAANAARGLWGAC
jgi:micrococcal nuclease